MSNKAKKDNSLAISVASGFIWTFGERIIAQLITATVTMVLARLLLPEDFGAISIVMVFITICNVFVTNGIGSALVQQKEIEDIDYNTAFLLNIFVSFLVYLILFICSSYISSFYKMPILIYVIRVMGLRIPIAALNSVQQAYIRRRMEFKKFFFATLIGTLLSGIIGIMMAINGAGIWAIVAQYLINAFIDTCVLSLYISWKPRLEFSYESAKKIFMYGSKLLLAELIASFESNFRVLLVGHSFGTADLAFYEEGQKYPSLLTANANAAINQVMLPVFSKKQDYIENLKHTLRKAVRLGVFVLTPVLVGVMVISTSFVMVVLTPKWLPCVPYIRIFCIYYLTRPLEAMCGEAIKAIGKTGWMLKKMIIVNGFALFFLIVSVFVIKNTLFLATTMIVDMIISVMTNSYYSIKYLKYTSYEQLQDFFGSMIPAVIMGGVVFLISLLIGNGIFGLVMQIVTGVITYVVIAYFFFRDMYNSILDLVKRKG